MTECRLCPEHLLRCLHVKCSRGGRGLKGLRDTSHNEAAGREWLNAIRDKCIALQSMNCHQSKWGEGLEGEVLRFVIGARLMFSLLIVQGTTVADNVIIHFIPHIGALVRSIPFVHVGFYPRGGILKCRYTSVYHSAPNVYIVKLGV